MAKSNLSQLLTKLEEKRVAMEGFIKNEKIVERMKLQLLNERKEKFNKRKAEEHITSQIMWCLSDRKSTGATGDATKGRAASENTETVKRENDRLLAQNFYPQIDAFAKDYLEGKKIGSLFRSKAIFQKKGN